MTKLRTSAAFVARSANGVQTHRAAGIAAPVTTRSISSTVVVRHGIHSRRAGSAPAAVTNGAGQSAYAASAGRGMRSGMKIKTELMGRIP